MAQAPNAAFEANDTIVCVGNNVSFTDMSVQGVAPLVQWNWSFGDGSTSTQQNPIYAYTNGGNYAIRLIVTDALGNRDTAFGTIYVLLAQTVQSVIRICAPQSSVQIIAVDPALTGVTGTWFTSSSAVIQSPANDTTLITNLTTGTYIFYWVVSDGLCSDADQVTVVVDPPITANAGPDQQVCSVPGTTNLAGSNPSPGTGLWSTTSSAILANPANRNTAVSGLNSPGTYTFIWTVTNGACVSRDTMRVVVTSQVASNAGPDQQICSSSPTATLAATSPSQGIGQWSTTSAAVIANPSSPTSGVSGLTTAGIYQFIWTVTNGPCITRDTMQITVTAPVTSNAGPDQSICTTTGQATLSGNNPAPGTGAWTALNGGTIASPSSASTLVTGLTTAGIYNFVWTITSTPCVSRDTIRVIVNSPVTANAGADQIICASITASLSGNNPSPGTASWSGTAGLSFVPPGSASTTVSGLAAGNNIIVYTITVGACISRDTVVIRRDLLVAANAGPDIQICETQTSVTMAANTAAPGTGTWTALNGGTITTPSSPTTTITGLTPGLHNFVWTITNGSCVRRDTVRITVNNQIPSNAGLDQSICQGATLFLSGNNPTPATGQWSTSSSATIASPSNPSTAVSGFTSPGLYTFVWTVTNGACVLRDTVRITADASVTSNAGADQNLCALTSATLSGNNAAPGMGLWTSLGSAIVSNPSSPSSTVSGLIAGNNLFVWTLTNGACVSRDTVNIVISTAPTASAGADLQVCGLNGFVTLMASTPSSGTGLWTTTSVAIISNPNSPSAVVTGMSTEGSYSFVWTVTNGACSSSDTLLITVSDAVNPDAGPDMNVCAGNTITLSANNPVPGTGLWTTTGSGTFADPTSPTTVVTNLNNGTNVLYWTITNGSCVLTDIVVITNYIPETAIAGSDQQGCAANSFALAGNTPLNGAGLWTTTGSAVIANPSSANTGVSGLSQGINTFIWTVTNGVCTSSDTTTILVYPMPVVDAGADQYVTSGTTVTLGATPAVSGGTGPYTYSWSPAAGLSDPTVANPSVTPAVTTTFYLTVTDSAGCSGTDSVTIWLNNPPDAVNDSVVTDEDTPLVFSVLPNDSDPDSNINPNSIAILAGPFHGIWNLSGPGTGTYIPGPDFNGTDSVQYVICDTGMPVFCDTAWVFITVNPVNDAPLVQDDFATTLEDSCISFSIFNNDSDVDQMLDFSTFNLISAFSNGTYTVDLLTGVISYCPDSNFIGNDTLIYAICDSGYPMPSLCDTAVVIVSVLPVNDAPLAWNDTTVTCAADLAASIVTLNDTDPDGDLLSIAILTAPAHGTALLNTSQQILYTSDPAFAGWDSVQYAACDPAGLCDSAWLFIYVHPLPQANLTATAVSCYGDSTGAIDLTMVVPGTYSYSWSHGPTTEDVTGLGAGIYSVIVSDSNGCAITLVDTVAGPAIPFVVNANVQSVACFGDTTGSIDLLVSGGMAPYQFVWSNGGSSEDLNNLATGVYTVTVTDSLGCVNTLTDSVSGPSSALQINVFSDHIKCFGSSTGAFAVSVQGGASPYQYQWSHGDTTFAPTGLTAGIYSLTITDSLGCVRNITDSIIHLNPAFKMQESINQPACLSGVTGSIEIQPYGGLPPYTYLWATGQTGNRIENLTAGYYQVVITDSAGCNWPAGWMLTDSSNVNINLTGNPVICAGDSVMLQTNVIPKATYTWYQNGGVISAAGNQIAATDPGVYAVEVSTTCGTFSASPVSITVNPLPSVDAGSDLTVNCDTVYTLYASGALTYSWWPSSVFSDASSATPQIQVNNTTVLALTGTDANGCSATDSLVYTVRCEPLDIPEGFSPNGDGFNDFFVIGNLSRFPDASLSIFNRWGNLVYMKERYDNTWNGFSNVDMIRMGEVLPDGTYFYVVDTKKDDKPLTGFVVLRR